MNKETIRKATVKDVLQAFWWGIYPNRGIFFLALFLCTIAAVLAVLVPLYYKRFFDLVAQNTDRSLLAPKLIQTLVLIVIGNGVTWVTYRWGMFLVNRFQTSVMARLKQMSFEHLIDHSYAFFSNTFTGSLVQRINRFSRSFEKLHDTLTYTFIPLVVQVIGVIIILFLQQPVIAYFIMVWIIITGICSYFFAQWKLKYDLRAAAADSATTALLSDTITNQNTVSTFVGSQDEIQSFKDVSNNQARMTYFSWNLSTIMDSFQGALVTLIEFFIFYYAVKFWQQGLLTIGTFVLIQVYILGLSGKLWGFGRLVRDVYEGFADSEEMVRILIQPHEVKDISRAKPLGVSKGEINFQAVSFSFLDGRDVLKGINLAVKGGERVAFIGPSGAGKSTLVKLLLRLYNLHDGTIKIDGQDTQKVTQASLRRHISLVPQDPILFHRTLMENIRYGNREASDEEVIKAARLAHCDEFIEDLPLKYETFVGERGIKLSGGERQRVAIARAILKNAPILILDEATSSLDSHSESLIQDALDKLMKGKTTIVIAHRLSTIKKMDRIVVIDNGVVIEEGSHDDLVANNESLYKYLWNLQAGGFLRG